MSERRTSGPGWSGSNLLGTVPTIVEMQLEAGAAGAVHGAATKRGPGDDLHGVPGPAADAAEHVQDRRRRTPAPIAYVAARTLATHALSIFGDHSDVMSRAQHRLDHAVRVHRAGGARLRGRLACGGARLPGAGAALLPTHSSACPTRSPISRWLSADDLNSMIDPAWVEALRSRGLTPDAPVLRGTAQNPDAFFQAREACNPFYDAVPDAVRDAMRRLEERTGRHYDLVEYHGDADAERVRLDGVGGGRRPGGRRRAARAARRSACWCCGCSARSRPPTSSGSCPRPFSSVAVYRTKEPGVLGEPLYQDVPALAEAVATGERATMPRVVAVAMGCRPRSSPRRWPSPC